MHIGAGSKGVMGVRGEGWFGGRRWVLKGDSVLVGTGVNGMCSSYASTMMVWIIYSIDTGAEMDLRSFTRADVTTSLGRH
jgi:hypothetical protein